ILLPIIFVISLGLIILAAVFLFSQKDNDTTQNNTSQNEVTPTDNTNTTNNPNTDDRYIDYDASKLSDEDNVIFFAASWCPTCRALDEGIKSDLSSIPADLTILKADYDKETDLKKKY